MKLSKFFKNILHLRFHAFPFEQLHTSRPAKFEISTHYFTKFDIERKTFFCIEFMFWTSTFRILPKVIGLRGFYHWNSRIRNPSFPNFQISNFWSRKKWRKKTCQNAWLCTVQHPFPILQFWVLCKQKLIHEKTCSPLRIFRPSYSPAAMS